MTSTNPIGVTRVIVGVDTHRDEHVAVAIDCLGARLGQRRHFGQVRGPPSCRGIHRCPHRHSYRGSLSGVTTFAYTPYGECHTECNV